MKNSIREFKEKLKLLTSQLPYLDATDEQVQQLKKSVYVLSKILDRDISSAYGPHTPIAQYSLN